MSVGKERMEDDEVAALAGAYGGERAAAGGHLFKLHTICSPKVLANDIRAFTFRHRPCWVSAHDRDLKSRLALFSELCKDCRGEPEFGCRTCRPSKTNREEIVMSTALRACALRPFLLLAVGFATLALSGGIASAQKPYGFATLSPGTLNYTTSSAVAKVLKEKAGINILVQPTAGDTAHRSDGRPRRGRARHFQRDGSGGRF